MEPENGSTFFTERNGIYIIDLQKTVRKFEEAYTIRDVAAEGKPILFVGTKKQLRQQLLKKLRDACVLRMRWLGGMLNNFKTIPQRIDRLNEIRNMETDGT